MGNRYEYKPPNPDELACLNLLSRTEKAMGAREVGRRLGIRKDTARSVLCRLWELGDVGRIPYGGGYQYAVDDGDYITP